MDSTSYASTDQSSIMTIHLCPVCLRRLHTAAPNPRYTPIPPRKTAKYKCQERI